MKLFLCVPQASSKYQYQYRLPASTPETFPNFFLVKHRNYEEIPTEVMYYLLISPSLMMDDWYTIYTTAYIVYNICFIAEPSAAQYYNTNRNVDKVFRLSIQLVVRAVANAYLFPQWTDFSVRQKVLLLTISTARDDNLATKFQVAISLQQSRSSYFNFVQKGLKQAQPFSSKADIKLFPRLLDQYTSRLS